MTKKISITGIGMVKPDPTPKKEKSFINLITKKTFLAEEILGSKGLRHLDSGTLGAMCATYFALENAQYRITPQNAQKVGLVLASITGNIATKINFHSDALKNGYQYVNPAHFPNTLTNAPLSQVAIKFGIKGTCSVISAGINSFSAAYDYAENLLSNHNLETVLIGTSEELSPPMKSLLKALNQYPTKNQNLFQTSLILILQN